MIKNIIDYSAIIFFICLLLVVIFVPFLTPYSVAEGDITNRLVPPQGLTGPHILGTDYLGRDVLTRLLYGTRISLLVGGVSIFGAALLGTSVGLLASWFRGWVDTILMRIVDVQLSFPFFLLVLFIAAVLGPSLKNVIITLTIATWAPYARLVRGEALSIRENEFIEASEAIGAGFFGTVIRHILPNIAHILIVYGSLEVGRLIISEAAVSFLGYGVQPPTPSWGVMIAEGRNYLYNAWWLTFFPGIMIILTTVSVNLIGERLRESKDPYKSLGK
jgi:peptide/nickel transport system permease protein